MNRKEITVTPYELEIFKSMGEGASWSLNYNTEDKSFLLTEITQYGMMMQVYEYTENELPAALMHICEIERKT